MQAEIGNANHIPPPQALTNPGNLIARNGNQLPVPRSSGVYLSKYAARQRNSGGGGQRRFDYIPTIYDATLSMASLCAK